MCQYCLMSYDKCNRLMQEVNNMEDWLQGIWGSLRSFRNFYVIYILEQNICWKKKINRVSASLSQDWPWESCTTMET